MYHRVVGVLVLVAVLLGVIACSAEPAKPTMVVNAFKAEPATNKGDAIEGAKVFARMPCLSCHKLGNSPDTGISAPTLDKIGTTATTRIEGVTAAQYIRHALVKPEDLNLAGYRNIMSSIASTLSAKELDDLVAYLLSLK